MRKVVVTKLVSLDGYVAGPGGDLSVVSSGAPRSATNPPSWTRRASGEPGPYPASGCPDTSSCARAPIAANPHT